MESVARTGGSRTRNDGTAASRRSPLRLRILVGILCAVCLAYGVAEVDRWRLRHELIEIAEGIVDEHNESDPLADGEEPRTDTDCTITVTREYLLFGRATGKISFDIVERASAPRDNKLREVLAFDTRPSSATLGYIYMREHGRWRLCDSYRCSGDECIVR